MYQSHQEAQLRALENRFRYLENELVSLKLYLAQANQQVYGLWSDYLSEGTIQTTCPVLVSGKVTSGCNGTTGISATLAFTGNSSGNSSGTLTTDASGNYSGVVKMIQGVDTGFNYTCTPSSSVYASTSGVLSGTCNGSATLNLSLAANSGYSCVFSCATPIDPSTTTITITDPTFGNTTLTWNSTRSKWSASKNPSYAACATASCAPQPSIHIGYEVDTSANLTIWWDSTFGSNCPANSTATNLPPFTPGSSISVGVSPTSTGCSPLSASWSPNPSVNTQLQSLYCTSTSFTITGSSP